MSDSMIISLINKLKARKQHLENLNKLRENIIEDNFFDITIVNDGYFFKVEISDYISIKDYIERMNKIDKYGLIDLISNNVLWNTDKQKINKGIIYVIQFSNQLYNIIIDDNIIKIDERITVGDITFEKIISINIDDNNYKYSSLKHRQNDTFYVKCYYKTNPDLKHFALSKDETYEDISTIINNLECIDRIESIIDLDLLKKIILDDLNKELSKHKN